jgi:phosphatidylserine/phosphatidylglycerophosphate/cardiolipin synthase-like enzyme
MGADARAVRAGEQRPGPRNTRGTTTTTTTTSAGVDDPGRWFLTAEEWGNPHTELGRRDGDTSPHTWTEGNAAVALVHGADYFARLLDAFQGLEAGDLVLISDWRGDADERLAGRPGTELGTVLVDLLERGVEVRGLIWRSHPDEARFSEEEAIHLAETVNRAGGEILLDERVRRGGSHHQKLVLLHHREREERDVAFVGGIDLCHGRRDDERHWGDPQPVDIDPRYGDTPPWHDLQLEVRGPAVRHLFHTFRERWNDATPLDHRNPWRASIARVAREPRCPEPLRHDPAIAEPAGPHAVQVLRTYPAKRPPFPFAPDGERSIARAYTKAFGRARRFIYLEDQYLWSAEVARVLADALRRNDELHLVAVVPRYPEHGGRVVGPAARIGHQQAIDEMREAGGDRVAVYDLENDQGTPVYVHAKVCVVDDVWAIVGSDNLNLRSWTHDSELSCAVLDATRDDRAPDDPGGAGDGARRFARDLRLRLAAEHLGRPADDPALLDPEEAFATWRATAEALDAWYRGGRRGARPPGRIRPHRPGRVRWWAAWWAKPLYRAVVDPDGRPRRIRRTHAF